MFAFMLIGAYFSTDEGFNKLHISLCSSALQAQVFNEVTLLEGCPKSLLSYSFISTLSSTFFSGGIFPSHYLLMNLNSGTSFTSLFLPHSPLPRLCFPSFLY